ncbi:MAG TPA: hypothetical protein DIT05_11745 [Morganella sp. (in: Bacteria)]|nr:hypothetical protein [Morganella sp. (in: enterobacteria)]
MADNIALNHERIAPGVPEESHALRAGSDSAEVQPVAGQYDDVILERESRERLDTITDELSEIKIILYNDKSSEYEVETALARYKALMNKENMIFIHSISRKWSDDAIYINNRIHDFEISKELITHEYYDEQLHVLARYSHDISLKYHREGMSGYMEFYKGTTKILNDYGNYIGDVVDKGKKTQLKEDKFKYDLIVELNKYIPNVDEDKGFIYKSDIEIVPVGKPGFYNVIIDGEIIESNVSYKSAMIAVEGFFNAYDKPINGTRFIRQIIPEKDAEGNVVKLRGKVRQYVAPVNFSKYLSIGNYWDNNTSNIDAHIGYINKVNIFSDKEHCNVILVDIIKENANFKNKIDQSLPFHVKNPINNNGYKEIDVTKMNVLSTRLDGIKKELQLSLDEFTQHYSTKNSNYENMVKNITNMISDLFSEIKHMLRN